MSNAKRQVAAAALRKDFPYFLRRAFRHLNGNQKFHDSWHLRAICHRLKAVELGGARLIVNVPPRSLKSITISVAYVAWRLGQDPRLNFVCVSYSSDLALKHARDCRELMQSDWYRGIFPATVIARAAEHDFETTAGGGRFSTSVGGTLTGRGGDIIIIDDPIKPDEAASASVRAHVNEWYGSTLYSRLDDKVRGSIILVMQRVHEEDLSGHLLETSDWDHLCLPAIAETDELVPIGENDFHHRLAGEALQPSREPVDSLERLRREMGSAPFSAQYQQAPVPAGGLLVERNWLQRYSKAPEKLPGDTVVQSWDCASKDGALNDYSACVTALVRGQDIFILDVWRGRVKFPELIKKVIALAHHYGPDALLIEDTASGTALIQMLRNDAPVGVPRVKAIQPKMDKVTRMSGVCHIIEAGGLILPKETPWIADFERELLAFPGGRTDDQVDALSQLLNWKSGRKKASLPAGPVLYVYDEQTGHTQTYGSVPWCAPGNEDEYDPNDLRYGAIRRW